MRKRKLSVVISSSIITMLATALVVSFSVSIALYNKSDSGNGTYGKVSLRSYYESGSGSENDPFVITRPRHLYNFSRLQGLGIYGEKTYFQLGKVDLGGVDSNNVPMCYASDTSNDKKPYLDMSSSNRSNNPINAIGSEALPFYGVFDGQNVEIKNLNVYAAPQDAGLFGYTAHGSTVKDLFLSNISIHAQGYTSDYADLYAPGSLIGNNAYFVYHPNNGQNNINYTNSYENTNYSNFFADNNFVYTEIGSDPIPTLTITAPSNSYTFSALLSGDLITIRKNNNVSEVVPNMNRLFEFFKEEKAKPGATFPFQASSTASLVVSSVDQYGQKHSKVLLSVEYDFTLDSSTANFISMGVRVAGDHGNNIGLVVGHCDGTLSNCYVYNGSFYMNDGGQGYSSLPNGSDLGLVGRVGGTVQNVLAQESDIGVKDGKNIGVLDFSTIYNDIISNSSFSNSTSSGGGVTYEPILTSKYEQYLRKNDDNYITQYVDSVSFRGRKIITNTDLGVFTIATDARTTGMYSQTGDNIERSVVLSEDNLGVGTNNDDYYVYYSTGEYSKSYNIKYGTGITFENYKSSFNNKTNTNFLPGYHVPQRNHLSKDSFETREAKQNYFFRFKLDPNYRKGKGFYFSDVDTNTDGGAFLANYFNYKLVDQNSDPIRIGDNKCGIMLKNNLRQEIGSFSASFACPDLSPFGGNPVTAYCLEDDTEDHNRYVSNMVNFEISNELANVTIVAAPTDNSKPSAVGIYKLDNSDFEGTIDYQLDDYNIKFTQKYNEPDYAFFMPAKTNLSYFDYRINSETHKGEVGIYKTSDKESFIVADNSTEATVPSEYQKTEYGYDNDDTGKTRLFAHTFCLPKGRYCIGSPLEGTRGDNPTLCVPKIYYICAQGQDNGQFDFDDNVFSSTDRVADVDFVNVPRFNDDGTPNITIADITSYDPSSPTDGNKLGNRRCYIALVNSDRSEFGSSVPSNLLFVYDPESGKFRISSTTGTSAITRVTVDNYKPSIQGGNNKDLTVVLLGVESNEEVIVYQAGD